MKPIIKVLFHFSLLIYALSPLYSQAQLNETEEIRKLIHDFHSKTELLRSKGHDVADEVIAFLSSDFHYDFKGINIMNSFNHKTYDLNEVRAIILQLRASNMKQKLTINEPIEINVKGVFAHARYSNSYELSEGDRMINKGTQYIDMILKKYPEFGWKIAFYNTLEIDDQEFKGMCITEIYQTRNSDQILTETILPDGSQINVIKTKFNIDTEFNPRSVRIGFKEYQWFNNGQLYIKNRDGGKGEQIGLAKSEQEMVLTLLKKEVFPDRCFNVIRKLK